MSLDAFLDRQYDLERYNCLHHAAEVWKHLTGEDILTRLEDVLNGVKRAHVAGFEALARPVDPCLALLRRRGGKSRSDMHVGVYVGRRIIHITKQGVQYMPVDVVRYGFSGIRYWR